MIKKKARKTIGAFITIAALTTLLPGCPYPDFLSNITVVNTEPRIGRIFLTDPSGEFEVAEVWSKSYSGATSLSLSHEMVPGLRAVFRGWTRRYPAAFGGRASNTFADTILSFHPGPNCEMVSPRFEWIENVTPLWLDAGSVVFASNRDGGSGIWKISPTGGIAERVSLPEYDDHGVALPSHRLMSRSIAYAWRGSKLVAVAAYQMIPYLNANSSFEVWNAATGSSAMDGDAALNLTGTQEMILMSQDGDLLWAFSEAQSSGSPTNSLLSFQRDGSAAILNGPSAESAEYATNGTGQVVFGLYYDDSGVGDVRAYLLGHVYAIDVVSGTMAEASKLGLATVAIFSFSPVSLSHDGKTLLLCTTYRSPSSELLGTAIAVVHGDGACSIPQRAGTYLPIDPDGMRFSHDGAHIVARSLSGTWGLYSFSDGSLVSELSGKPADASPDFASCIVDASSAYRFRTAADGNEPGGGGRVLARKYGDNTDILRIAEDSSESWMTGPLSGDSE